MEYTLSKSTREANIETGKEVLRYIEERIANNGVLKLDPSQVQNFINHFLAAILFASDDPMNRYLEEGNYKVARDITESYWALLTRNGMWDAGDAMRGRADYFMVLSSMGLLTDITAERGIYPFMPQEEWDLFNKFDWNDSARTLPLFLNTAFPSEASKQGFVVN